MTFFEEIVNQKAEAYTLLEKYLETLNFDIKIADIKLISREMQEYCFNVIKSIKTEADLPYYLVFDLVFSNQKEKELFTNYLTDYEEFDFHPLFSKIYNRINFFTGKPKSSTIVLKKHKKDSGFNTEFIEKFKPAFKLFTKAEYLTNKWNKQLDKFDFYSYETSEEMNEITALINLAEKKFENLNHRLNQMELELESEFNKTKTYLEPNAKINLAEIFELTTRTNFIQIMDNLIDERIANYKNERTSDLDFSLTNLNKTEINSLNEAMDILYKERKRIYWFSKFMNNVENGQTKIGYKYLGASLSYLNPYLIARTKDKEKIKAYITSFSNDINENDADLYASNYLKAWKQMESLLREE